MPRRHGASIPTVPEKWAYNEDTGEWAAQGRATIKGRVTWSTRKRRNRIGKIKASHKARRRND